MEAARRKAIPRLQVSLPARARKILNIHLWAPAFTGFGGGIGAFSRALAMGVKHTGHSARLFGKFDSSGTWHGLPLSGPGTSSFLQTSRFASLCLASCARTMPDHVISTHLNFGPLAHLTRRLTRIPYTLVAHGIDVHPGLSKATLSALRAADSVIAVSSWTRRRLLELGVDAKRVKILHNTINEAMFAVGSISQALMERYGIEPNEKVLLTVARLDSHERYKGYDRLVQALPQILTACGKVRLILVGDGCDIDRVRRTAANIGVENSIAFAGFIPDAELADHYRLADVFAMPSTGEGFGIVYLEAMACGTPVLSGNHDGSVDALAGGTLGKMVDPENVKAIADGVVSLLRKQGPSLWFDRVALRDAVVRKFGQSAFTEKLGEIVSTLSVRAA